MAASGNSGKPSLLVQVERHILQCCLDIAAGYPNPYPHIRRCINVCADMVKGVYGESASFSDPEDLDRSWFSRMWTRPQANNAAIVGVPSQNQRMLPPLHNLRVSCHPIRRPVRPRPRHRNARRHSRSSNADAGEEAEAVRHPYPGICPAWIQSRKC